MVTSREPEYHNIEQRTNAMMSNEVAEYRNAKQWSNDIPSSDTLGNITQSKVKMPLRLMGRRGRRGAEGQLDRPRLNKKGRGKHSGRQGSAARRVPAKQVVRLTELLN